MTLCALETLSCAQTACINNHVDLVAELVRRGASLDTKAGGKTALHFCATFGHPKCAQILLQGGARADIRVDVDNSDFTENDGLTALEIVEADVARHGQRPRQRELLHMLREGAGRR